jgi:hypothetical protein
MVQHNDSLRRRCALRMFSHVANLQDCSAIGLADALVAAMQTAYERSAHLTPLFTGVCEGLPYHLRAIPYAYLLKARLQLRILVIMAPGALNCEARGARTSGLNSLCSSMKPIAWPATGVTPSVTVEECHYMSR